MREKYHSILKILDSQWKKKRHSTSSFLELSNWKFSWFLFSSFPFFMKSVAENLLKGNGMETPEPD